MNNLVKKLSVFIFTGLILTYLIIELSIKYYPEKFLGNSGEYSMWMYQSNKIKSTKNQHLNLIIGDSRGMSDINPIFLSVNYTNFSIGGATFFEGYKTIKRIIEGKNKIDTLILCYGQFHYELNDVFQNRTLPFNFINNKELIELQKAEKITNFRIDYKNSGRNSYKTQIKRFLILNKSPVVYQSTYMDNLRNNNIGLGITKMIESLNKNNGHTLFGQSDSASSVSQEAHEKDFIPNKLLEYYLDSIFLLAKQHGITVYIATPPISSLTYKSCNPKYLNSFDSYLSVISKKHNCTIINYSTVFKNTRFGDPSHLNKLGCVEFSKTIKRFISSKSNQNHQGSN
jgi:hypothetical protein